jgi:hypothetical protein
MDDVTRSLSYLVINGTYTEMVTTMESPDVWQSLTVTNDSIPDLGFDFPTNSVTVQVTLCMTSFAAREMKAPALRQTPVPREPVLSWDVNEATWAADDILRQLDTSHSIEERGVFDLDIWSYDVDVGRSERPKRYDRISSDYSTVEALDLVRDNIYAEAANKAQYTVFSQLALSTGNPALALQAYFTTLCATAYYNRIITFDKAASSTRTSLTQVNKPLGWAGFIIVLTGLLVHLFMVIAITLLFLRAGKMSLVDNAWAAVSQLLGPETEDWIKEVDKLDDRTIKKWLEARGEHDILVQLKEVNARMVVVSKD